MFTSGLRRKQTNGKTFPTPVPTTGSTLGLPTSAGPDADISSTRYKSKRKALMDLNNELRDMSAETMIPLPRIAVIGSQSAGKSSLVEAVSGISVPRDGGTCTRCPMECLMSSSTEEWSCSISLRMDYGTDGNALDTAHTIPFSPRITDKGEVDIWLRRAQAAILNPGVSSVQFRSKDIQGLRDAARSDPETLQFSKNVVVIDIKDPDAVDLSFVDLPGLIQNADQDDLIDLVRGLVVANSEEENTIILITIPMSDDMQNQPAVRLARRSDPEGKRTIGVLTKPDTLTQGSTTSRQKWKEILQGDSEPDRLKHGYYCVRLPDDDERSQKISRHAAVQRAAQFFDTTPPWKDIADRSRFGIPSLVINVSRLLVQLIEQALPSLKDNVNALISECEKDIARLPPAPEDDPKAEIMGRITQLCTDLKNAVYGKKEQKQLSQNNRRRYLTFKEDICSTAPDFRPLTPDECSSSESVVLGGTTSRIPNPNVKPLDVIDVAKAIQESITWELPYNIPFEAKRELIHRFIALWRDPSISCFNDVFVFLEETVGRLMSANFGQFPRLEGCIRALVAPEISIHKNQALIALDTILRLDTMPLYTQNTEGFGSERKKWLGVYKARRNIQREKWGVKMVITDAYEDELTVMAEVQAYFEIAHKRIIDTIPLTIEHSLNQALVDGLQRILFRRFFVEQNSVEKMKELVSEDPATVELRSKLEAKMLRLIEIKKKLDDFGRDSFAE